jgi:phosphohistidine phosphatase
MRYMLLMRHAQAAFPDPGMTDFDRPLTSHGHDQAKANARALALTGLTPDHVLCSPARRAMETLTHVVDMLGLETDSVQYMSTLYTGDPATYLAAANAAADSRITMLIGHNPMLEDCALELAKSGNDSDIACLRNGFPTGAIAVFKLTGKDRETSGILERLITDS